MHVQTRKSHARFRSAVVTVAAAVTSFCMVYAVSARLDAGPNAAIMAAVLALSLARRPLAPDVRSAFSELGDLFVVAVAASLVGRMLHALPILGAAAFVAGMFLSLWLRRFGNVARRIGALLSLPLVAILVAPAPPKVPAAPIVDIALVLFASVATLVSVRVLQYAAQRVGFVAAPAGAPGEAPERPPRDGSLPASTRMALQMAVALTAAFAIGFVWFPAHWTWIVLTAFIVCSGSRGRGDVVYKSVLRLAGALAGTIAAAVLQHALLPSGAGEAALIFAVIFVGVCLRDVSYAYWACCVTLVVAMLQRESNVSLSLMDLRLAEILIGAICGAAASWFVLPVRTESVVLKSLAGALLSLEDAIRASEADAGERAEKLRIFERDVAKIDSVAKPVELHWRVRCASHDEHPAVWIDIVRSCVEPARSFSGNPQRAVRSIRGARKALGERAHTGGVDGDSLTSALRGMRAVLANADASES